MSAPQKKNDSFEHVRGGYYRDPDPAIAAEALAFALEASEFEKDQTQSLLLISFARMAEVSPEVNARFRQLLLTPSLDAERRRIVGLLVDPPERLKEVMRLPTTITGPHHLDL